MSEQPNILIVDDDISACETIEAQLHPFHYQLSFAHSGEEAFRLLSVRAFDLVLCDVMMPVLDGFEVCRRIRAHPDWRFTPLILVTALDGRDDLVQGLEAGADEFISKPVDKVVLRARVRAMLRIRKQYLELRGQSVDVDALMRTRREQIIADGGLSEREREVLEFLLLGRTHIDIAEALGISVRTAKFHQSNILRKIGAESRADLTRIFV